MNSHHGSPRGRIHEHEGVSATATLCKCVIPSSAVWEAISHWWTISGNWQPLKQNSHGSHVEFEKNNTSYHSNVNNKSLTLRRLFFFLRAKHSSGGHLWLITHRDNTPDVTPSSRMSHHVDVLHIFCILDQSYELSKYQNAVVCLNCSIANSWRDRIHSIYIRVCICVTTSCNCVFLNSAGNADARPRSTVSQLVARMEEKLGHKETHIYGQQLINDVIHFRCLSTMSLGSQ